MLKILTFIMMGALLLLVPYRNAFAAPLAAPRMAASDVVDTGDGVEFTLSIDISEPSEPYSSLDFNLVSSDYACLAIVDRSPDADRSSLAVAFAPGYGNAYHEGRIDSASGAVSYLIGIFSPSGGNAITSETNICAIRMRYTGQEAQELAIRDMKLIYKTSDGLIASVPIESHGVLTIAPEIFAVIEENSTPLSPWSDERRITGAGASVVVSGAIAAISVVSLLAIKRRKGKKAARIQP